MFLPSSSGTFRSCVEISRLFSTRTLRRARSWGHATHPWESLDAGAVALIARPVVVPSFPRSAYFSLSSSRILKLPTVRSSQSHRHFLYAIGLSASSVTLTLIYMRTNCYHNLPVADLGSFALDNKIPQSEQGLNLPAEQNLSLGLRLRLFGRFLFLVAHFFPLLVTFPIWFYANREILEAAFAPPSSNSAHPKTTELRHGWWVALLRRTLESGGAAFIKLGQYISSRTDLFPSAFCSILSKLQSRVGPHRLSETKRAILQHLGSPLEEIFSDFSAEPIGVGAIAQVHKAKLNNNEVAVKVLHPGVAEQIELDLQLLRYFSMFVEYVFPDAKWISLSDEVRVFSSMMRAQTNLRVEAEHLTKFSRNFKASNTVQFPNPLLEYCSNDVLVEEYVDGIPLARLLEVVDGSANEIGDFAELKKEIAGIGINAFLKMLLQDNFVHSDLHPGNLLVTFAAVENTRKGTWSGWWGEDNETYREQHEHQCGSLTELANLDDEAFCNALNQLSATSRPVLVLVDTGLVSSLSQANLTNLRDLLVAVSSFDGIRVSHLLAERSPNPGPVHDMPLLESRMSELLASVKRSALRLSAVTFGGILISVFDMVRQHQVKLEGEFANVGIALMLVEGIGRRLDPNVDLLQFLRSFLPSSSLRML